MIFKDCLVETNLSLNSSRLAMVVKAVALRGACLLEDVLQGVKGRMRMSAKAREAWECSKCQRPSPHEWFLML